MPKRTSKNENDVNVIAFQTVKAATEEKPTGTPTTKPVKEKNPAAVALGRLGGLKGGKARAASLSAQKRKEIARKAAQKRWSRKSKDSKH